MTISRALHRWEPPAHCLIAAGRREDPVDAAAPVCRISGGGGLQAKALQAPSQLTVSGLRRGSKLSVEVTSDDDGEASGAGVSEIVEEVTCELGGLVGVESWRSVDGDADEWGREEPAGKPGTDGLQGAACGW